MPTKAQLAKRVLVRMGELDPDENPTFKEDQDIQEVMLSVYSSLKDRGYIQWDLESIPVQYQDAFINVVADRASPDFGVNDPVLNQRGQMGLKEIYALSSRKIDTRESDPVDY